MISFKQIGYALAVERTLHFKKAADDCAVSPSALSTALAELEKQIGFSIFERDNKKVLVTPLGKQFLEKARDINLQMNDLYHLSETQHTPLSLPMSMGVIPTIAPYLLPRVMPALRHQYPKLKLHIVEEQSHVLLDKVKNGELDVAILALPFAHDGLLAFEFWQEDFYWVAHADDVSAKKKEVACKELQDQVIMLLKDGHCLKEHALAACKMKPGDISDTFSSTSLNTLVQMVVSKLGTTLVPSMALGQLVTGNIALRAIHLNEPGPHRTIAFIIRPNYTGANNIQLLMRLFRACLAGESNL